MKEYGFHPEIQKFRAKQEHPHTLEDIRESLKSFGCRHPLLVWNDWIIDGHRRYPICVELDLPFKVLQCNFLSVDDAKHWIYENLFTRQDKRRQRAPRKSCERSEHPVPPTFDWLLPEARGTSPVMLPPEKIRLDCQTQSRLKIDRNLIKTYADAMRRGDVFPPIYVFQTPGNNELILVDGFHRFYAHAEAHPGKKIAVLVRVGTIEEALWESYSVNATHGKGRGRGDQSQAVRNALQHPFASKMSNYQIADHLSVDESTVRRVRKSMESTLTLPKSAERTGKDGRTINTVKIGKADRGNADASAPPEHFPLSNPPKVLVTKLLAQHEIGYVEELVFVAMEAIRQSDQHGNEMTNRILLRLMEEYGK